VIRYIISFWFTTPKKFDMASGVDSNEVAFLTERYEIMGRKVSSLLGDQELDGSSRWISTAVITYSFCILDPFIYCIFETSVLQFHIVY
jgi:hypothetical protein